MIHGLVFLYKVHLSSSKETKDYRNSYEEKKKRLCAWFELFLTVFKNTTASSLGKFSLPGQRGENRAAPTVDRMHTSLHEQQYQIY